MVDDRSPSDVPVDDLDDHDDLSSTLDSEIGAIPAVGAAAGGSVSVEAPPSEAPTIPGRRALDADEVVIDVDEPPRPPPPSRKAPSSSIPRPIKPPPPPPQSASVAKGRSDPAPSAEGSARTSERPAARSEPPRPASGPPRPLSSPPSSLRPTTSERTPSVRPAPRGRLASIPAPPRRSTPPPAPKPPTSTSPSKPPLSKPLSKPPAAKLDGETKPTSQPPPMDLDERDWERSDGAVDTAAQPAVQAYDAKALADHGLSDLAYVNEFGDEPFDGAKTQKVVRKTDAQTATVEPASVNPEPLARMPFDSIDDESDFEGDRSSQSPRKRRKRPMLKIPDDNVPATPAPSAVFREASPGDDEVEPAHDGDDDTEAEDDRSHMRESVPGIFTDESAIGILRPIQIVSDLPAVESLVDAEEVEPEAEPPDDDVPASSSLRRPPPPPRSHRVEDIEEVEPERMSLPADEFHRRPPPPPPRNPEASGRHPALVDSGVAGAASPAAALEAPAGSSSAGSPAAASDDALANAEAVLVQAEARAREAEAKAREAEAKAREAAAKSAAQKKPWWAEVFEDDFIRTLDNPKKRDIQKDVDFIEKSLRLEKGSRVLDLACGTGVHAVELASRGYQVVGVDYSHTMLKLAEQYGQQRNVPVSFIHGDMRKLNLEGIFDGIYCWSSSFGYFDDSANALVLERIARALRPGGMFALDIDNRDFIAPRSPSMAWFEKPGAVCMDEMRFDFYSSRMYTKRMVLLDTGKSREIEIAIRLYTLHELGRLLHKVGFKVVEVSGHRAHRGAYFGSESPRIIVTGQRREE